MSVEEFALILERIKPFSNYIYLHVLGEPLLHPQLNEILNLAQQANINVNITSNGGLLSQKKEVLLKNSIRQLNISLHDAEENVKPALWSSHIRELLELSLLLAPKTYISLRLWNNSNESSKDFNTLVLRQIAAFFNCDEQSIQVASEKGIKLSDHVFLQHAPRFYWPNAANKGALTKKNCYAMRDHIAILADGTVVPCCLDANGEIKLGNIFTDDLTQVLSSARAQAIKKGFEQGKIVEPMCATCGFILE